MTAGISTHTCIYCRRTFTAWQAWTHTETQHCEVCNLQEDYGDYPEPSSLNFSCELCGAAPFQPCDRWCWSEVDEYATRFELVLTNGLD